MIFNRFIYNLQNEWLLPIVYFDSCRYRHVWKTYIFPNATHLLPPFAIGLVVPSASPLRWIQRGGKMQNVTPSIWFACNIGLAVWRKMPSVVLGATKSISIIRTIGPRSTHSHRIISLCATLF